MSSDPKNMEELVIWLVVATTIGLSVSVIALTKYIVAQLAEKGAEHARLRADFDRFRDSQLSETRDLVREATRAAVKGEERERLLSKMVAEVLSVMSEQRGVIHRAMRLLRRYEPTSDTSEFERKSETKKPLSDDDTSAIFRT